MNKKLIFTILLSFGLPGAVFAEDLLIADFDQTTKYSQFVFKDDKGSQLTSSSGYQDPVKGYYLGIKFSMVEAGGIGYGLNGLNISQFRYFSFSVKGEKGGETFEVGLRDKKDKEMRVKIEDVASVTTEWQTVKIPLSSFTGVDTTSMNNFHFAFAAKTKGRISIDDIKFTGAGEPAQAAAAEAAPGEPARNGVNKVLVDGFERTNASDRYYIYEGDDSSLKIEASRFSKEGDYALQMEYTLATTKPQGTWVSVHLRSGVDYLNWAGAREIKLWVYGDGTENILRFNIIDSDGDVWMCEDRNALSQTKWNLVSMPLNKFTLYGRSSSKTKMLDPNRIKSFEIAVWSKTGINAPGSSSSASRIYLDQLYILGENINANTAAPANIVQSLRIAVPSAGNVDLSGIAYTEYYYSPQTQNVVNHWGKLAANAKVDKYSVKLELVGVYQEFGDSAYYIMTGSNTSTGGGLEQKVNVSDLHVIANDPFPGVTKITLGNIWMDYTPYTFAGAWGYKGATVEGDIDALNYHFFVIKGKYNNFTTGTRAKTYFGQVQATGILVYSEDTARLPSISNVTADGQLQQSNSMKVEKVSQDTTYTLELRKKFFTDRMQMIGTYGNNIYKRFADADYTDPYNPIYNNRLDSPVNLNGQMGRMRMEIYDIGVQGLNITTEYRQVSHEFKPKYRNDPSGFDDSESDQQGGNVRVTEWYKGFNLSAEWDRLLRDFDKTGYRNRLNIGLGYYGVKGLDMSLSKEIKHDKNNIVSGRSGFSAYRDDDVITNELYVRTQIKDNMVWWFKFWWQSINSAYSTLEQDTDSMDTQFEYYLSSNAKLIAEYKLTRYTWIIDDNNFTRVYFEVTF
jgi:hypothetical protein